MLSCFMEYSANTRFIEWSESNMIRVCSGTLRVLTNESGYIDRYYFTLVNNVVTLPRFWVTRYIEISKNKIKRKCCNLLEYMPFFP